MYWKKVLLALRQRYERIIAKLYQDKLPRNRAITTEMSLAYKFKKKLYDCVVFATEIS